jgi:diguanylate cyclase (GGDEF)-like protein
MECEEKIEKLLSIIERVANRDYERDNWRNILDSVAELFEADGAAIAEIKGDFAYYTRISGSIHKLIRDYDPESFRVPIRGSALEEALKKGYFIVNNYQNYSKAVPTWKSLGLKCKIIAILGKDEPFGSISVGRIASNKPFTEEDGKILKNLAFVFSFMVREELEKQKLLEKAIRDHLTKLYNRLFLEEEAIREIERAKRYSYPISLIMFDLDDFKSVNDSFGHHYGDKVLVTFAGLLKSRIRTTDIPVRYGGEEFIVLLPHTFVDEAFHVAERIRREFEKCSFEFDKEVVRLTVSAGVSSCERGECSLEELIRMADRAMYFAKRQGRNRVEVFSPELN